MKYLLSLLLLFCGLSAFSQADTIFVLGAEFGATTEPTDSTFTVDIIHPTDQLGQAFTASKIQIGYRLIDVFGRLYRVKSVDATGIGSSTLTVVELQDAAGPSGTGLVYRKPDNSDCIPEIQTGDIGISYALAARIANHNAVNGCSNVEVTAAVLTDSMAVVRDSIAAVRADIGTGGGIVETIVAGTGISVNSADPANPIVTNTAPDQTVSITGAGSVAVTGTYPNFTATGQTVPDNWRNITGGAVSTSITDNVYRSGNIIIGTSNPSYNVAAINTFSTTSGAAARFFTSFAGASTVRLLNYNGGTTSTAAFSAETAGHDMSVGLAGGGFSGIYSPGESFFNASSGMKFHANTGNIRWTFTGAHTTGMLLTPSQKLGIGGGTAVYTIDVNGTDAALRLNPHDVTLTGAEGLLYADLSEKTFKGHNGTSFFRFMQQSATVPANGQIGVFNSTTLLYEPSNPKARSYTPTSTADTNGATGDIAYDDSYIYIKTSAGWKRSALSTF